MVIEQKEEKIGYRKTGRWFRQFSIFDIINALGIIIGFSNTRVQQTPGRPLTNALLPYLDWLTESDKHLYAQAIDTANPYQVQENESYDSQATTRTLALAWQERIFIFVDEICKHGWDEDKFRLMMVQIFTKSVDAKDKGIINSTIATLRQIAETETYTEQERIAYHKKWLVKKSPWKIIFGWARQNQLEAVAILLLSPFVILSILYQILNLIFG